MADAGTIISQHKRCQQHHTQPNTTGAHALTMCAGGALVTGHGSHGGNPTLATMRFPVKERMGYDGATYMASCTWYRLLRPLLFRLPAETSHRLIFTLLDFFYRVPGAGAIMRTLFVRRLPPLPVSVMGLRFSNPVGLAAGLDKNAEHIRPLSDLGFGFLEVGTVTPRPQPGNPSPRMFRLTRHAAIINRMGFNNVGVYRLITNLVPQGKPCPIGINIGKNRDTPVERAVEDYLSALHAVYKHADYVAVNISSPNTAGLRDLQNEENLDALLRALKAEQASLAEKHGRYVPIALKIAPDLDDTQIAAIAELVLAHMGLTSPTELIHEIYYRDLQRHRILTQERQDFTTVHGYDTPPEIEEAGFKSEFDDCMKRTADLYERIYADLPSEAQYVVPFAYKIRWYMKMNLREALHMCELRTMPQGHPDYRFICQEMWRKIQEIHPALAESGKFIDWQKYRLGRLQSEMRTEFKKSALEGRD